MGDRKDGSGPGVVEVVGPDGSTYRVCSRRRGEPLRRWDGVDTAFGPLDLLIFVASLGQRAVTAVRVRTHRGWTVGFFATRVLGGRRSTARTWTTTGCGH